MNAQSVTLEDVLVAASVRGASLVPETSGYLALAVADATARLPFRIEDRAVALTTEGSVTVARGSDVVPATESARVLRDLLARLLAVSAGTMPGLTHAARSRSAESAGVDGVIRELEAALIPVNRAAARRALARLARETLRAKSTGTLRRGARKPAERAAIRERVVAAAESPQREVFAQLSEPAQPVTAPEPERRGELDARGSTVSLDDIDVAWGTPVAAVPARALADSTPPDCESALAHPTVDESGAWANSRAESGAGISRPVESDVGCDFHPGAAEELHAFERTPTPTEVDTAWVEDGPAGGEEIAEATVVDAPVAFDQAERPDDPARGAADAAHRWESEPRELRDPEPAHGAPSGFEPRCVDRREVVVVEAPRIEAIVRAAVAAAVVENEARAPRVVVRDQVVEGPPPAASPPLRAAVRDVSLRDPERSRVEDLLATFGGDAPDDDRAVRAVAAGLKTLAGLEPTPPPVGAMLRSDDTPTPPPVPVRSGAPPPVARAAHAPRRSRSLTLPLVVLLAAAISLGWLFRTEIQRVMARVAPAAPARTAAFDGRAR